MQWRPSNLFYFCIHCSEWLSNELSNKLMFEECMFSLKNNWQRALQTAFFQSHSSADLCSQHLCHWIVWTCWWAAWKLINLHENMLLKRQYFRIFPHYLQQPTECEQVSVTQDHWKPVTPLSLSSELCLVLKCFVSYCSTKNLGVLKLANRWLLLS